MLGDRRFAQLVDEHAGALTAYARAVAPDRWTADDVVQETLLRAWRYRDSFRASGSFEGWLIRICLHCLFDRSAKSIDQLVDQVPDLPDAPDGVRELYDIIGRLPIHQREVIAACGLLGYDYIGAAELLEIPVGTVRSRLFRARAAIAAQLAEGTAERA